MAAYLIGQITVRDSSLWQNYVAGVAESLASFDTRIIFRGTRSATLAGTNDRDLAVVIEFSDQKTLQNWFNSDRYQGLIPLRDRAADVVITTYEAD
ncbi:MAG: DUF1330 domain-containing protein [Desulfuromonadales bacterium]|nr:DUF1330 domain-containing protein [Desulfuromonadales bacterium]